MRIYLDHNATAPLHSAAAEVLRAHAVAGRAENPSSIHRPGQAARSELADARRTIARWLGADPADVVFTASGSEANALALRGALASRTGGRRRILASAIEHASVLKTLEACAREQGVVLELLPVDGSGRLDLERAERALGPDVLLASLMLANNETGVLQPVHELALRARTHGILVHCDAAQAVGKMAVDFADLGVDLLCAGGHKFGGGLGAGVLLARRGTPLAPLISGHQERALRGGTENVAAIAAMAAALSAQIADLPRAAPRIAALRDRLERGGCARIPGARVNGAAAPRLPNTANLAFPRAEGEAVLIALDLAGVAVSTGAACASGTLEPSHVLLAMGMPPAEAKTSVRFSLGSTSTQEEIDRVLDLLPAIVEKVRVHASGG